jgi:hypothetical protein
MFVSHWWLMAVAGFLVVTSRSLVAYGQNEPSVAPEPTAVEVRQAAERFDQGRAAFKEGRFIEAAEHFEAADARAPTAVALGLAMQCRAQAGQVAKGATLAAYAMRRYPTDVDLVSQSKTLLAEAKASTGKIELRCAPACEVLIDRKIVHGEASTDWELYVEPGSHDVSMSWANRPVRTEHVDVQAGRLWVMSIVPVTKVEKGTEGRTDAGPLQPGRRPMAMNRVGGELGTPHTSTFRRWSPVPFWVGVGLTTVAGVATVWSGIDTINNPGKDKVQRDCAGKGTDCATYQEAKNKELRTNVLLISTGVFALATTAVGLFATDFRGGWLPWTADSRLPQNELHKSPPRMGNTESISPWLESSMSVEDIEARRYHIVVGTTGRF